MKDKGFNLEAPPSYVLMDGNCLFSMIALARNSSLQDHSLHMTGTQMRTSSISWAVERIGGLDEEELQRVRMVATPETQFGEPAVSLTRQNLIERLQKYAEDGQYAGNMGDILVYIVAAFLQAPILIVDVNHSNAPVGLFVSPRTLFGTEPVTNVPFVGVRLQNHFEGLFVPEETKIPLAEMFAANDICGAGNVEVGEVPNNEQEKGSRRETSKGNEETERMIPIATSTPMKDFDGEQLGPSGISARHKATRALFQGHNEHLQASLVSSVELESTNYTTQVH